MAMVICGMAEKEPSNIKWTRKKIAYNAATRDFSQLMQLLRPEILLKTFFPNLQLDPVESC
jgi:hypothetical protein